MMNAKANMMNSTPTNADINSHKAQQISAKMHTVINSVSILFALLYLFFHYRARKICDHFNPLIKTITRMAPIIHKIDAKIVKITIAISIRHIKPP